MAGAAVFRGKGKWILIVVAVLAAPVATAIYGGELASEGEHPYMVHLYLDDPHEGLVCGGTLIAPTYVLTAAHCVVGNRTFRDHVPVVGPYIGEGRTVDEMQAMIGCTDLSDCPDGETIQVAAGHQHPEYTNLIVKVSALYAHNDIAVLELEEASRQEPARPAGPSDLPLYPPGTPARVLGWGCTPSQCFPDHPEHLMQVDVPVWADAECLAAPNYLVMFHAETELCAGEEDKDSCGGDSGGPLLVHDEEGPVVIGIVSYGALFEVDPEDPFSGFVPCGSGQHPGVYTEVAAYQEFLRPFH